MNPPAGAVRAAERSQRCEAIPPADHEPLPPKAWLVVALLWFVALLNYLDRVMLITMRTSVKAAVPMTDAQFGLLTTVFLLVYALCSPFGGFIVDRVGRSRIIVLSLLSWSVATWATSLASTWTELMVVRGVMVGTGLGGLGGWLAERHGWTFGFHFFGWGGVAYSVLLALVLRDRPPNRPSGVLRPPIRIREAVTNLFSRGAFTLAMLFWGLLGLASWGINGWMPSYFGEQFHLAQGKAGLLVTGLIGVASILGMIAGGAWADRWSRTNPRGRILVGVTGLSGCCGARLSDHRRRQRARTAGHAESLYRTRDRPAGIFGRFGADCARNG